MKLTREQLASMIDHTNLKADATEEAIRKLCKEAARFYHQQLKSDVGKPGRAYLVSRGMDWQTVTKFGIGFATDRWHDLEDAMRKKGFSRFATA